MGAEAPTRLVVEVPVDHGPGQSRHGVHCPAAVLFLANLENLRHCLSLHCFDELSIHRLSMIAIGPTKKSVENFSFGMCYIWNMVAKSISKYMSDLAKKGAVKAAEARRLIPVERRQEIARNAARARWAKQQ